MARAEHPKGNLKSLVDWATEQLLTYFWLVTQDHVLLLFALHCPDCYNWNVPVKKQKGKKNRFVSYVYALRDVIWSSFNPRARVVCRRKWFISYSRIYSIFFPFFIRFVLFCLFLSGVLPLVLIWNQEYIFNSVSSVKMYQYSKTNVMDFLYSLFHFNSGSSRQT
jgi:hypothetical protein